MIISTVAAAQLAERIQGPSMLWGGGSTSQQQAVLPMLQEVPQQAVCAG